MVEGKENAVQKLKEAQYLRSNLRNKESERDAKIAEWKDRIENQKKLVEEAKEKVSGSFWFT